MARVVLSVMVTVSQCVGAVRVTLVPGYRWYGALSASAVAPGGSSVMRYMGVLCGAS